MPGWFSVLVYVASANQLWHNGATSARLTQYRLDVPLLLCLALITHPLPLLLGRLDAPAHLLNLEDPPPILLLAQPVHLILHCHTQHLELLGARQASATECWPVLRPDHFVILQEIVENVVEILS